MPTWPRERNWPTSTREYGLPRLLSFSLWVVVLAVSFGDARLTETFEDVTTEEAQPPKVEIVLRLPNVSQASTDADIEELISDNLKPDIDVWWKHIHDPRSPRPGQLLNSTDFLRLLWKINTTWPGKKNYVSVVVIRNNTFRTCHFPTARGWCTRRVDSMIGKFEDQVRKGAINFPDAVFIMNAYDRALCHKYECGVPIFSFDKRCNATGCDKEDILMPVFNHRFDHLVYYPWESKVNKAFMRAGMYAAMHRRCGRMRLFALGQSREGKDWLDVGIYKNKKDDLKHLETASFVPLEQHAKWKYLLSADGQAASWRLAKLMALNSLVLKYDSDWVEYYYRSLKNGSHYLTINARNLLPTLRALQGQDEYVKGVVQNAQQFAYRYLYISSRVVYARRALEEYSKLFSDMSAFVATIPEQGCTLEGLLGMVPQWVKDQMARAATAAIVNEQNRKRRRRRRSALVVLTNSTNTSTISSSALLR